MRRSPYADPSNGVAATMRNSKFIEEDPVKLIEHLQDYVLRLQSAAESWKDNQHLKQRQCTREAVITDRSARFDYQKARDLPPKIRSVVEDNRMLRSVVKDLKARCNRAEYEAQKERRNALQTRTQLDELRRIFPSKDVEELKRSEELKQTVQELQQTIDRKDSALAVLGKKETVTLKSHAADLAKEEKQRKGLQQEIDELKQQIHDIALSKREEAIRNKQLRQKYEALRKKASEWKRQVESYSPRSQAVLEDSGKTQLQSSQKSIKLLNKDVWTGPLEDESVVVMLCLIDASTKTSSLMVHPQVKSFDTNGVVSRIISNEYEEPILICEKVKTKEPISASQTSTTTVNVGPCGSSQEALDVIRDAAAVKIQSCVRGMLARRQVEQKRIQLKQQESKPVLSRGETDNPSSKHRSLNGRSKLTQLKSSKSKATPRTRSEHR